jgi:hypothetical protein
MKFKEFYKKLKKKNKNRLPQAANVHTDTSNMPNTASLPAATGGNQPRLS